MRLLSIQKYLLNCTGYMQRAGGGEESCPRRCDKIFFLSKCVRLYCERGYSISVVFENLYKHVIRGAPQELAI